MDGRTFDRVARLFSTAGTRRAAVQSVLATFLGGSLLDQISDGVDAAPKGNGKGKGKGKKNRGGGQGGNEPKHDRQNHRPNRKRKKKGKSGGSGGGSGGGSTCAGLGQAPTTDQACCNDLVPDGSGLCNPAPSQSCEDTCFGANFCCDEVCANGNCCDGDTHVFCGPGETCDTPNGCKCGDGPACASGETCVGDTCTCAEPRVECGGQCQTCLPGNVSTGRLSNDVSAQVDELCCKTSPDDEGFCRCGAECCDGHCFQNVPPLGGPITEFCCTGDLRCDCGFACCTRELSDACDAAFCDICRDNPDGTARVGTSRRNGR